MTTFEIIKALASERKMSVKELARHLNFGESTIYKWKNQEPKAGHLEKVADYFGVSVDYLLGREQREIDPPSIAKQMMFRMDTTGLSESDLQEIEKEVEGFLEFRMEKIREEKNKKA